MMTIDTTYVCDLPMSRKELGFDKEGDRGNAVLLIARDMQPAPRALYQQAGYIRECVCISCCTEEVFAVLEQMHLRWCARPDRGFTLAVLAHSQASVLSDRLIISRLKARDDSHDYEKEA